MKLERNNIWLILFYLCLMLLVAYLQPVHVDWTMSYDANHTKPYGVKVLKTMLTNDPNNWDIEIIDEPLYERLQNDSMDTGSFLFLNREISADTLELSMILDRVADGNDLFVGTEYLPEYLADTLGIDFSFTFLSSSISSADTDSESNYNATLSFDEATYDFDRILNYYHIIVPEDSTKTFVGDTLGMFNDEVCFMKFPFQEGNIYIHSLPILFTNYHMLKHDPAYALECLHQLDSKDLYWEQYYLRHKIAGRGSPLFTFLQQPSFKWAYWMTLFGIFVFVLFRIKREQRAIPIVEPYKNQSKLFAETIGRLYYNRGDHRNLSLKAISHFKEHLHKQFYFSDVDFTYDEAKRLAIKSGYELSKIEQLFNNINNIRSTKTVTDGMLSTLYKQLQNFYK